MAIRLSRFTSTARQRADSGSYAYAVSQFATTQSDHGATTSAPTSLVHGKLVGASMTLCGHSTAGWHRFYWHPFTSRSVERCRGCVRQFRHMGGGK